MKFRSYIQGDKRGREANRLEREAMEDPFLADAIEGFEKANEQNVRRIADIRRNIKYRTRRRHSFIRNFSIAASVLLCLGFGIWFLSEVNDKSQADTIALSESTATPEEEMIAQPQTELSRQQTQQKRLQQESVPAPPALVIEEESEMQSQESEEISIQDDAQAEKSTVEILKVDEDADDSILELDETVVPARSAASQMEERKKMADIGILTIDSIQIKSTIEVPQPVSGIHAYKMYLLEHLKLTDNSCLGIKGTIIIEFAVDKHGHPQDIVIKKPLCPAIDNELIRLISKGEAWTKEKENASIAITF